MISVMKLRQGNFLHVWKWNHGNKSKSSWENDVDFATIFSNEAAILKIQKYIKNSKMVQFPCRLHHSMPD